MTPEAARETARTRTVTRHFQGVPISSAWTS